MPRPRTNDPSNLPSVPNTVTNPEREAVLVSDFTKRLAYLMRSHQAAKIFEDDALAFNRSLERLRRGVVRKRKSAKSLTRLHPEIEMVISYHARRLALEDGCELDGVHVRKASLLTIALLEPRQGRPGDRFLELHVEGLVALLQEFSGKPVIARRTLDSEYHPHFAAGISRIVPMVFEDSAAGITEARLVRMVERIRRKYAGRPLRFLDLLPGYGMRMGEAGEISLRPGLRLERFEPNIPIYCP